MTMRPYIPLAFLIVGLSACSGKLDAASAGDAGLAGDTAASTDTSLSDEAGPAACVQSLGDSNIPTTSRSVAVTCTSSSGSDELSPLQNQADGGIYTPPADGHCATDLDCPEWGSWKARCTGVTATTRGDCTFDQCNVDSDCPGFAVCACSGAVRGYAGQSPGNACVASTCRTDSDCGAGGRCAASAGAGGPFYGIGGYYCHSAVDECQSDSDCCVTTPGAYCAFDPTANHWACSSFRAAG
jgi:hypothetical protein